MDVALPSAHKVISFPSAHTEKVISLPSAHVSQKVKATFFTLSNASLIQNINLLVVMQQDILHSRTGES